MKSKHLLGITLAVFIVVFAVAEYTINTSQTQTTQTPGGGEILNNNPSSGSGATPTPVSGTTSSQTSSSTAKTYTLADIAQHNTSSSCWTAINGKVYDVTSWINAHPGGPEHILSLCGSDGSGAFNTQHGGQSQPAAELAQFYIGELAQ